jgi:ubiquinone/menaquinone biosynthesis C-methylase UbiE/truncated hemoglobin YjbI
MSLYSDLGGAPAITAALDHFYPRVLADPRISPFFNGVNIEGLKKRIAPFLAMALGGPNEYHGPGLRQTHARLESIGLNDGVFDAFLGHFEDVLKELGVPPAKIAEIMPLFYGGRGEVVQGKNVNPNKALWEKGDFTEIAAFMRHSGEAVVQSIRITPPLHVLDLGCGDGTTAVPLARTGAEVTGIDIARNLVEAGNRRAAEAGLKQLRFQEGDACNLEGVADHSFDMTISVFGAMFAPRPFDVAKEMVRVTKPGGRIVMGNWIPNDPTFVSQLLKISSAFTPPPPEGFISPMTWGVENHIIERFAQAGVPKENISMIKDTYYFASPVKTPAQFIELFETFYGPTMNAVEAANKNMKAEELHNQLVELANSQNKSKDAGTLIPATFMRVTVSI